MLELNRIYNLKCEDGIPQLADNSIDLVVTSPPYNVGWGGYIDNRPYEEYINWLEGIFSLLYPKLCPGGRRCVNIGEGKKFTAWAYGIWRFAPESQMVRVFDHDAVFPEELPRRCIKMLSWIGAVVLDPFSGTGTTAVVAYELGRNYIGFEEVKKHYQTSLKRLRWSRHKLL